MRPRIVFPLMVLVLASCSGSAKPTASASTLPAATVVPTAAVVPTTTTAVTTTAPPTTVPPVTTAAKTLEVVIAEAAAQNWMVDREGCYLSVDTCDPTTFTPEGSVQRDMVTKVVTDYRAANFKSRRNAEDPSYIVLKRVVIGADRTSAEVTGCIWDTDIVFEPDLKATGGEIISNDKKQSEDVVLKMVLVGKRWLISERTRVTTYEGFNTCPAR